MHDQITAQPGGGLNTRDPDCLDSGTPADGPAGELGQHPVAALSAAVVRMAVLPRDPFDETATMATPDVHVRRVVFGEAGMASFYIDPAAQLISVFAVVWAG